MRGPRLRHRSYSVVGSKNKQTTTCCTSTSQRVPETHNEARGLDTAAILWLGPPKKNPPQLVAPTHPRGFLKPTTRGPRLRHRSYSVVRSKAPQHASPAQPILAHETQGKRLRFRNWSYSVVGSKAPQLASPAQLSPAHETQGKRFIRFRNRSYCAAAPKVPQFAPPHSPDSSWSPRQEVKVQELKLFCGWVQRTTSAVFTGLSWQ